MRTGARILVVENDTAFAGVIREWLCQDDFSVELATTTAQAWVAYSRLVPDVIVLDLDLDRPAAREFIREMRSGTDVPIIVLSVANVERHKVAALEAGADDYMTRPLGLEELLARIRAALRHSRHPYLASEVVVRIGDLEIDLEISPVAPRYLLTESSAGYRLATEPVGVDASL